MIRSLENPTHQESQPFSPTSHSQSSTIPSVGNEVTVLGDQDDLVIKISPNESPTPNEIHLNQSFEQDDDEPGMKGQIF